MFTGVVIKHLCVWPVCIAHHIIWNNHVFIHSLWLTRSLCRFVVCLIAESPRRYVESDVNIHYRTPVRYEYKDPISDAELVYRQEQMKKLYQEERRRKYLQELQDMSNRRHTDNFTPSQKSPIPLNRYDDFGTDYASVGYLNTPRTIARGLYNFQGQSARWVLTQGVENAREKSNSRILHFSCRELSFKKGDIIYIRREIDKNWFEGEHNAMVGLLPANYVEVRITTNTQNRFSTNYECI